MTQRKGPAGSRRTGGDRGRGKRSRTKGSAVDRSGTLHTGDGSLRISTGLDGVPPAGKSQNTQNLEKKSLDETLTMIYNLSLLVFESYQEAEVDPFIKNLDLHLDVESRVATELNNICQRGLPRANEGDRQLQAAVSRLQRVGQCSHPVLKRSAQSFLEAIQPLISKP